MARVSRAAAARSKRSDSTLLRGSPYQSIHSLQSEEGEEEEFSCTHCLKSACTHLYNFTVASCLYVSSPQSRQLSHGNLSSSVEDIEVSDMKDRLKFRFMNPFQKWRYAPRRRFPWKLILQILNICLVTLQIVIYATTKFALTHFVQQNQMTFSNLFINNVATTDADHPVPSPVATVYSFDDLFNQINFTAYRYYSLMDMAVGPYGYRWADARTDNFSDITVAPPMVMSIRRYKKGRVDPEEKYFQINGNEVIDRYIINNTRHTPLEDSINETEIKAMLNSILDIQLNFTVSSVYLDPRNPTCFQFHIVIKIKNDVHSGNMPVDMTVRSEIEQCDKQSTFIARGNTLSTAWITTLDVIVIVFVLISTIQCILSLVKSAYFSRLVKAFFIRKFKYKLKFHQVLPLFNLWFIMVIISNVLVIAGTVIKILLSLNVVNSTTLADIASIILGVAVIAQWCGILRFLSYFDKYNMLLLTLRLAMPSVLRFIVCAGILYIAFLLCGWLVMGPYHPKFRDPSVTSECLFSLINGDDMYATYQEMSHVSMPAFVFSKIYLYVFIALFIYVVLSVFISLISDTYETLHEQWTVRSKGLLQDFANDQLDKPQQRARTYSDASQRAEDEDYELIREADHSTNYGAMESQPLLNGGPVMGAIPSIQLHHPGGSAPPSLHMNRRPVSFDLHQNDPQT